MDLSGWIGFPALDFHVLLHSKITAPVVPTLDRAELEMAFKDWVFEIQGRIFYVMMNLPRKAALIGPAWHTTWSQTLTC